MPRARPLLLAILAAAAALAVFALVYVMERGPVHAPAKPDTLARLALSDKPQILPGIAFRDAAGKRLTLADFRGRHVLVNLWATWCAPCVQELPSLLKLKQAMGDALIVVPVDVERNADAVTFFREHGVAELPVYRDADMAMVRSLKAYGLPLTLLIDPQGREIGRAAGPADWGAPESVAYLRSVTSGKP